MARETFTSLKATHDAHRIAADILYTPLDLPEFCPSCGQALHPRLNASNTPVCTTCGCAVPVPAHTAHSMLREEATVPRAALVLPELQRIRAVTLAQDRRRRMILITIFVILAAFFVFVNLRYPS